MILPGGGVLLRSGIRRHAAVHLRQSFFHVGLFSAVHLVHNYLRNIQLVTVVCGHTQRVQHPFVEIVQILFPVRSGDDGIFCLIEIGEHAQTFKHVHLRAFAQKFVPREVCSAQNTAAQHQNQHQRGYEKRKTAAVFFTLGHVGDGRESITVAFIGDSFVRIAAFDGAFFIRVTAVNGAFFVTVTADNDLVVVIAFRSFEEIRIPRKFRHSYLLQISF